LILTIFDSEKGFFRVCFFVEKTHLECLRLLRRLHRRRRLLHCLGNLLVSVCKRCSLR
jgi:hypothetical protein